MNERIELELTGGGPARRPGRPVAGELKWDLPEEPKRLEVVLGWSTIGAGLPDTQIVERLVIDNPGPSGRDTFSFLLPPGPFSFTGKMVSLYWWLEVYATADEPSCRQELIVSSTGSPVELHRSPAEDKPARAGGGGGDMGAAVGGVQ